MNDLAKSTLVQFMKVDSVAVITINNPPVNALSPGVPEGISASIDQVEHDADVIAAVVIGGGRTFVAGADIKEFVKMTQSRGGPGPGLLPLLLKIENCSKPVVIAIHGTAFGGGLELAMSGHYRVAAPTAQVGQPEVNLGLIPGAAGTQRLPRLAGVAKAVEMCTGGKPIKAQDALNAGIVDKLIDGDFLNGAVAFARRLRDSRLLRLASAIRNWEHRRTTRRSLPPRAKRPQETAQSDRAPLRHRCHRSATRLPFEEGCQAEAKLFLDCLYSDQSKALIHVFFAEREVAKIPDVPKETPVISVNPPPWLGLGRWVAASPWCSPTPGFPYCSRKPIRRRSTAASPTFRKNYANSVKRGRFTQQFVMERLKLIQPPSSYDDFGTADMVVEAVFEGMALRRRSLPSSTACRKPGAILATTPPL